MESFAEFRGIMRNIFFYNIDEISGCFLECSKNEISIKKIIITREHVSNIIIPKLYFGVKNSEEEYRKIHCSLVKCWNILRTFDKIIHL